MSIDNPNITENMTLVRIKADTDSEFDQLRGVYNEIKRLGLGAKVIPVVFGQSDGLRGLSLMINSAKSKLP